MEETVFLYKEVGDEIGRVQLVDHMGTDKTVVNAARVSFGNDSKTPFDERDEKLVSFLLKNKHTSPFEHCVVQWKFVVPLFVRGQHHRHRTWSYNEISRRYTDENIQFYLPNTFRSQHKKNKQASNEDAFDPEEFFGADNEMKKASKKITEATIELFNIYEDLLGAGIAREQARMILPQNMYTEYYGTVDLHNALHFLNLRLDPHSQWEIRKVAEAMAYHLKMLFPSAMKAYEEIRGTSLC